MAVSNNANIPAPPDNLDNKGAIREWMVAVQQAVNNLNVTSDPPIFAELTSIGVAFFTGEIDATQTGATDIGDGGIPTGKTLIVIDCRVYVQSVDTSSGSASATIKIDSASAAIRSATVVGSATQYTYQNIGGATANNAAPHHTGAITVTVTSAATCPQETLVVGVYGLLFND